MSKPNWLNKIIIPSIWIVGILIRLYGVFRPAQIYDIATFEAWSRSFLLHSPLTFFNTVWSDYLPLPILTFAPLSIISNLTQLSFPIVFKLVHVIIELALIYYLPKTPKILLLLSPALIGDTAFWGQVDSLPSLLALLSLAYSSPYLLGLAVAYKPIMILIAPVVWISSIKKGKSWWSMPLIASLVFFATALPTGGLNFIQHMLSRVLDQVSTYPYLTINAFNFWSLVPNLSWMSDSISVFNLSGHTLGLIIFSVMSLITLNHWRKTGFVVKDGYRVAATILITFFAFTTRMHERHLLFGLPFLAYASMYESWLLFPLILLTLTFTLNLYGAFYWVYHAQVWPFSQSIISLISWTTVISTLSLIPIWSWPKNLKNHKLLILILILASLLRFTNLAYPKGYIFDEVYHAFTSREYLNNHVVAWEWWTTPPEGVAYEWTHPPVAKYGMVIGMLLFGENSFGWRVGSASFGILSIVGIYFLVLEISKNKKVALLSALLVSIEGLHISQSRIAMNDIYMLNFYIWSLYLAVKSRWKGSAILFGLSLASKWSALYGLIPLAIIFFHEKKLSLRSLLVTCRLSLITLIIYILSFAPFILSGHTWGQWWELHRQMWYYHTHLVATHAYESTPLQWIFDARPVWYFVNYVGKNISNIYAISNPAILLLGLGAVFMQLKKIRIFPYFLFLSSYLIFTLPWVFSPRIMFFYHYLPSSIFLCILLASWLSTLKSNVCNGLMVICFIGLFIISPSLFGIIMPHQYWDTLFKIIPSWK